MNLLKNKQILTFVEDIYKDLEMWFPRLRLRLRLTEAGAEVSTYDFQPSHR